MKLTEKFDNWLYNAIEIHCGGRKDPHDVYPYVDLTSAKLSFMSGMASLEYASEISGI